MPTPRRVFRADLELYASLYVVADDEEGARRKIRERLGGFIEVGDSDDVSDLSFTSPDLPEFSFSRSMTISSKQDFTIELMTEEEPTNATL